MKIAPYHAMSALWNVDKQETDSRNILFQVEDKDAYIGAMLSRVCA
jgi:hypothetical protein